MNAAAARRSPWRAVFGWNVLTGIVLGVGGFYLERVVPLLLAPVPGRDLKVHTEVPVRPWSRVRPARESRR